jgi:nucleolar protein 58
MDLLFLIDINNICALCEQVVNLSEYRAQLFDYLRNRMNAVAPNLTVMVGELVGARLIAHAGSLLNLAKCPASTVQILGAEKALFRALKNKSNTPKYGLIYHASLVGQSAPKHKGKVFFFDFSYNYLLIFILEISRVLAAKTALSIRCDALGEVEDNSVGIANRLKVESRLSQLEGRPVKLSGLGKSLAQAEKYEPK